MVFYFIFLIHLLVHIFLWGLKLNVLPNIGCVVLVVKLNAVRSLAATNISVIKPRKQPPNISLLQPNTNKSLLMPIFFLKKHPVLVQAWNLCSPFVLHSVQVFVNLLIAIIKKKKKESFLFNNFSWSKVRRVHSISPHKSRLNLGKRTTFPFIKPR